MMIKRYGMTSRFSMASEFNGIFQTAGQVARDFSGDTRQQAKETLENIDALLAEADIPKSQVLSAMVWLADAKDVAIFNEVWDQWVDRDHPPTRACVESKMVRSDILVEVMITAANW